MKYEASRKGISAAFEQPEGWPALEIATRFLDTVEVKYFNKKLGLLGVVCSMDGFKFYIYGKTFNVKTDHRALLSILREKRANI